MRRGSAYALRRWLAAGEVQIAELPCEKELYGKSGVFHFCPKPRRIRMVLWLGPRRDRRLAAFLASPGCHWWEAAIKSTTTIT
jgi:hypothetical protein